MPPRWTVTPKWKRVRPPGFIDPCVPALVDHVPAGPGWLHELKWDGYRIIGRKEGASVKLWSRAGRGWHGTFPAIAAAVAALPPAILILDGEAVVLREDERFCKIHRHEAGVAGIDPVEGSMQRSSNASSTGSRCAPVM